MSTKISRICLVPNVHGVGGMVSFQKKFAAGLESRGIKISYDLDDLPYQAVLVIGGTRNIGGLLRAARRGVPIVQRLNGMNWLHRKLRTGIKHYIRSEYSNMLLSYIRRNIATSIIYQSNFAQSWWERVFKEANVPSQVIYNGVDLNIYSNQGEHSRHNNSYRILLVEGQLSGGYEIGLDSAIKLVERIGEKTNKKVELMVAGKISDDLMKKWDSQTKVNIDWAGLLAAENIPELDRSAHLLFSADINAACPNSVVEAMACGLPVAAFDSGALPEMLTQYSGAIAPYGGDPWKLDPPDIESLADASIKVLENQTEFRAGARRRAEEVFGLDAMLDSYLEALM